MKNVLTVSLALFCGLLAAVDADAAEGRIPISQKTTITVSGAYLVTEDFSVGVGGGSAITVDADHVSIDLGGHTITSGDTTSDIVRNVNNRRNISVINGKLVGGAYHVHFVSPGGEFLVEDVTGVGLSPTSGKGILVEGSAALTARAILRRNALTGAFSGIWLRYVSNGQIEGNNVTGGQFGYQLEFANNNLITRNSASANEYGIILLDSSNSLITDNTISDNTASGLETANCVGTIIDRNTISRNEEGIVLSGLTGASRNSITRNNLSGNTRSGIVLTNASYNSIRDNTVTGNTLSGILVQGAAGSKSNSVSYNVVANNGTVSGDCGIRYATIASSGNIHSNNHTLSNGPGGCSSCGICDPSANNVNGGANVDAP